MKKRDAIRLAAYFDGELGPQERANVEQWLARDPAARAALAALQRTRATIAAAEEHAHATPSVDSDQAWLELRRRIAADHQTAEGIASPRRATLLSFPRVLSAAAAVVALGIAVWWPLHHMGHSAPGVYAVDFLETDLTDSTPVIYIDEPSGWTVVWIVPAEAANGG